jgi:hypothetical protein
MPGHIAGSGFGRADSNSSGLVIVNGVKLALTIVLLVCGLLACEDDADVHDADASSRRSDGGRDAGAEDDFKGCPDGFANVAPGLQTAGELLALKVTAASPEEPERYINRWTVELTEPSGSPAPDAEIVRGQTFMPVHGHDGRVEPRMTALSEPARFEVDRLNFTMRGPWEVRLWLRSGSGADDYAVFEVCVAK